MKAIAGQISIFSYLEELNREEPEETPFCWDDDVNEIHRRLCDLASRFGLEVESAKWSIWEHVKNLGFRMWLTLEVTREVVEDQSFLDAVNEIEEYAKSRKVELSTLWNGFFSQDENKASLYFSTMFLDKARMKKRG